MRGREEGVPGIVKIAFENQKNEKAAYYVQGVDLKWQDFQIALEDIPQITDWDGLSEISFILESWNVDHKKGILMIDNINFSTTN